MPFSSVEMEPGVSVRPVPYEFDDDPRRVDVDVVWQFLSDGRFARAVSDGVGHAYLADGFVLSEHRGQGLGRKLVDVMIDQGPGSGFPWLLHTADAYGLYGEFGFRPPDHTLLERPHVASRRSAGDAQ